MLNRLPMCVFSLQNEYMCCYSFYALCCSSLSMPCADLLFLRLVRLFIRFFVHAFCFLPILAFSLFHWSSLVCFCFIPFVRLFLVILLLCAFDCVRCVYSFCVDLLFKSRPLVLSSLIVGILAVLFETL